MMNEDSEKYGFSKVALAADAARADVHRESPARGKHEPMWLSSDEDEPSALRRRRMQVSTRAKLTSGKQTTTPPSLNRFARRELFGGEKDAKSPGGEPEEGRKSDESSASTLSSLFVWL